jgi:hypothetical protein
MKRERDEGEEEVPAVEGGDEKRVKADEPEAPEEAPAPVSNFSDTAPVEAAPMEAASVEVAAPHTFDGYTAPEGHSAIALRARMLIGNKEAGIVIGKGGVNINKLREEHTVEVRLVQ